MAARTITKINSQMKLCILLLFFQACTFSSEVVVQAVTWHGIQTQLMLKRLQCAQLISKKTADNKEFFNLQQQLVAIYLAQKRYQLGFGTAFIPSEKVVQNYVRKKTFLDLKTKELLPLYKKKVLEYQKLYTTGELERIQKNLKELEALNLLHVELFSQLNIGYDKKSWVDLFEISEIFSIKDCVRSLQVSSFTKKSNRLLSWITPVAGIVDNHNQQVWQPLEGAVVLCPDDGVIAAVHRFEKVFVVFIKQRHFTYVINGFNRCCVKVGDKLKQGEPLGVCALKNPPNVELQLWQDDIILNPEPYHQTISL